MNLIIIFLKVLVLIISLKLFYYLLFKVNLVFYFKLFCIRKKRSIENFKSKMNNFSKEYKILIIVEILLFILLAIYIYQVVYSILTGNSKELTEHNIHSIPMPLPIIIR